MKIRIKLTLFFSFIFLVLIICLSIWYHYNLDYLINEKTQNKLNGYSNSFFTKNRLGRLSSKQDLINILDKVEYRGMMPEMIDKNYWIAIYDNNYNIVNNTEFASKFPLHNIEKKIEKKFFKVKLVLYKFDYQEINEDELILRKPRRGKKGKNRNANDFGFYPKHDNDIYYCMGKARIIEIGTDIYYIVMLIPTNEVTSYLKKNWQNVVFSLIILTFVIIIIGLLFSQYSLNPINKIIKNLNSITQKDLSKRLAVDTKNLDEINMLSHAINALLDRIDNSVKMEKQFISDVSHEFKTPLSILQLNIDNISNNPQLTNDEIDRITSSLEILYSLDFRVQKLLYLSQLEANLCSFHPEKVFLKELLINIKSNLEHHAEMKNLELKINHHDENLIIDGDFDLLYIAIYNLVENALKYTEKGYVIVNAARENSGVKLIIEDTGVGIPDNQLKKIFNKFYRVDSARNDSSGFGIGLTITKRILDVHKAKINVKSIVGKKTEFSVLFNN